MEGTPAHLVFVIDIVSVRFGGYFTPSIRAELEKFRYLQMLTLNDCGIVSLLNFPTLPALIRLDMVFNQIPGSDLKHLVTSKHLQTLMLGANQIGSIDEVLALSGLRQLMQLDFINNPVCKAAGYRTTIFDRFPTLPILDTLDKAGKDAYASSTMMQAVARVPDNLFDKSLPPPPAPKPVHVQAHKKQVNKLAHALARAGSLDSVASSRPAKSAVVRDRGKYAKSAKVVSGRSRSSRAGLIFPIGRINRKVK